MAGVKAVDRLHTYADLHIDQALADTWLAGPVVLVKGRAIQVGSPSLMRGVGRAS